MTEKKTPPSRAARTTAGPRTRATKAVKAVKAAAPQAAAAPETVPAQAAARPPARRRRAASAGPAPAAGQTPRVVTADDIRVRAYFLAMEHQGRGGSLDYWLQAERELLAGATRD